MKTRTTSSTVPILISWYMTPLAILLVLMAIAFGRPDSVTSALSAAIVLLSALMNVTSVILMQQSPEKVHAIRNIRVGLNYVANFFLLYLLLPFFPAIWILVLLMAIAIGIYNTFLSTLAHCAVFGLVLIGVASIVGEFEGSYKIGLTLAHVTTIVCFGPFINRLLSIYNPS